MQQQTIDKQEYRKTLGQFPTGVTVITTLSDTGEPVGMTASSFNSVSMDPPLILWSIDHRAHSLEIFENCKHFAINILSDQQKDVSNLFASTGADKFKDTEFTEGVGKSPLLPNCIAQLECRTWNTYDGGDHTIIVGEVMACTHDETQSALLFYQGDYAEVK
jgi:flavin reductase (DIM6/NTAB) family NADH-FMN oxidoreductase RutF